MTATNATTAAIVAAAALALVLAIPGAMADSEAEGRAEVHAEQPEDGGCAAVQTYEESPFVSVHPECIDRE